MHINILQCKQHDTFLTYCNPALLGHISFVIVLMERLKDKGKEGQQNKMAFESEEVPSAVNIINRLITHKLKTAAHRHTHTAQYSQTLCHYPAKPSPGKSEESPSLLHLSRASPVPHTDTAVMSIFNRDQKEEEN